MSTMQVTDKNDFITATFSADAAAGDLVNQGGHFGVSPNKVVSGAVGVVVIRGRWRVPKATGAATVQGNKAYFEAGAVYTTDNSGARKAIGKFVEVAASAATEVVIDLMPELY